MMFKEKIDRVIDVDKVERDFKENEDKVDLEKNDILALLIASFLVFVPVMVIIVLGLVGVAKLFFFR